MRAVLDDEGSQRYLDQQDILPAINGSLRRFNALVGGVFAENKGGEEMFREITMTRVFLTNTFGGFILSEGQLGHPVWSIVAIYPEALVSPEMQPPPMPNPSGSRWMSELAMRDPGDKHCRRITLEQVAQTKRNRFMQGNEKLAAGPRRSWSYAIVGDRSATGWVPGNMEVQLYPQSIAGRRFVGVSYLRGVSPITNLAQSIPYPSSAFQMLRDLALNEISIKQGAVPLFNVTVSEVRNLLGVQA